MNSIKENNIKQEINAQIESLKDALDKQHNMIAAYQKGNNQVGVQARQVAVAWIEDNVRFLERLLTMF